jgi:hypothetical protein
MREPLDLSQAPPAVIEHETAGNGKTGGGNCGRPMDLTGWSWPAHKVRALAASRPHFYAYVVGPEPYVVRTPIGHLTGLSRGPGIP